MEEFLVKTEDHHSLLQQPEISKQGPDLWMAKSSLDIQGEDKDTTDEKWVTSRGYYRLAKIYYDKADLLKAEESFLKSLAYSSSTGISSQGSSFLFKIYGFLIRMASEQQHQFKVDDYIARLETILSDHYSWEHLTEAEALYQMATLFTYKSHFIKAREYFLKATQRSKEQNTPEILAKSLYAIALSFYQVKDYTQSLHYLDQLQDVLAILSKSYLAATMHLLFANIYSDMGEFDLSLEHYRSCRLYLTQKMCWNLVGYVFLGEGIVFKNKGEFSKAIGRFELTKEMVPWDVFKRLAQLVDKEILEVNDSSVDLTLDRQNRIVYEKNLGTIDFKHRFILLEILFLLVQRKGEYFDKEQLAKSIWKDEYNPLIHDKLIYTSVSRLRKLIEPRDGKRKYIIRGKDGYAFNQNVKVRFQRENTTDMKKTLANTSLGVPV
jgi:tetratricopeptide (TPR) repeat protein